MSAIPLGSRLIEIAIVSLVSISGVQRVTASGEQIISSSVCLSQILDNEQPVEIDGGALSPDEPILCFIEVSNDTEHPFDFTDANADCGCTEILGPPSAIEPHGRAPIQIRFDMPGRVGQFQQLVICEFRTTQVDDPLFLRLIIQIELRRDIWLTDRAPLISYRSDSLVEGNPIQSFPITVAMENTLLDRLPQRITVTTTGGVPDGIGVVPADDFATVSGDTFRLTLKPWAIAGIPEEFPIALCIRALGEDGQALVDTVRTAEVRVQAGFRLISDPSAPFLGILAAENMPRSLQIEVSLEPPCPFRFAELMGQEGPFRWTVDMGGSLNAMRDSWILTLTLSEAGDFGAHVIQVPLNVVYREGADERERSFPLEVQWVTTHRGSSLFPGQAE